MGRELAPLADSLLSTSTLRLVSAGATSVNIRESLSSLARAARPRDFGATTFSDLLRELDTWLLRNRRNEFVYKNRLANKILIGRHSLQTSTMLTEFRAGNSRADAVIVNGRAHAYEIKTELDSDARLQRQLDDYRRVFRRVSLVVHESQIAHYVAWLGKSRVGLLALTARGSLSCIREASDDLDALDIRTMMASLRRDEYTAIIRSGLGWSEEVPNMRHFETCLRLANTMDVEFFHAKFEDKLRARRLAQSLKDPLFEPVRSLCVDLRPSDAEANILKQWLGRGIEECTSRI